MLNNTKNLHVKRIRKKKRRILAPWKAFKKLATENKTETTHNLEGSQEAG